MAFTLAATTACVLENSSVMLTWMPSFSSTSAAFSPSHVLAILMRMRSLSTPFSLYEAMMERALATLPSVSKDRRLSSSVDTSPGMSLMISAPTLTLRRSRMFCSCGPGCVCAHWMASSTRWS